MGRTLKQQQQPRRRKTEDREKPCTKRNETEISNKVSRYQTAFKRHSTTPRIGLASPCQPTPRFPKRVKSRSRPIQCRDDALSLAQAVSLRHSAGTCLPPGRRCRTANKNGLRRTIKAVEFCILLARIQSSTNEQRL